MFTFMKPWLRQQLRSEEGSSTIPFILFVPLFMALITSSLEMGRMLFRQMTLERAVDMAVRDLRLGAWTPAGSDDLKQRICNRSGSIPNCMAELHLDLWIVSKQTWAPLNNGGPVCVDRTAPIEPNVTLTTGQSNDLMMVRACVKFKPLLPTSGFGFGLTKDATGAYALVTTSAFVNEPRPGT
jgi:Flp pilus assembly protein TadG